MNRKIFQVTASAILLAGLSACAGQTTEPPSTTAPIVFIADKTSLQAGECTFLRWDVGIGFGVTLNGAEVERSGDSQVCPAETSSYELVVDMGDGLEGGTIEITVDSEVEQPDTPTLISPGLPAYQADSWVFTGGPPGGLGYDIRMVPDKPDIMFVTDAHSGVHKSIDAGRTWFPSNTGIIAGIGNDVPIFCLTIDPVSYDVIWAGTQMQGHVYQSTDIGVSWVEMDEGIEQNGRSIRGITIDPNDPNVVYAAAEVSAGIWESEGHSSDMHGFGGEVYKSNDRAQTWRLIWSGDNIARYVWVDPRNSDRIYVSTGIFDRVAANATPDSPGGVGILRSDDGGNTWTVLNEENGLGGLIIPSLFMHPENPDILIAAVNNWDVGGVFITYDGGDTWSRAENGPTNSDAVEISMSNPDIWYSATEGKISRSDDAGSTWETFALATQDRGAGMPIDLQVDPRDPYIIFDNNYGGGNFLSEDGGETWVDASKGYTGASIGGMVVLPGNGFTLLVGANTGAFRSRDGGNNWLGTQLPSASQFIHSPDGLIASDSGGSVWHSQDDGQTWAGTNVVDLMTELIAGRMISDVASMRALAVAPSDPNVLYLGFNNGASLDPMPNIYRSDDGGYTWQELVGVPFANKGVLRIAVHPDDSQELIAATIRGLYHSSDGGQDWVKLESFDLATKQGYTKNFDNIMDELDLWVVNDVVYDPFDAQVIYATAQSGGVWRSDDGGQVWRQISAGMDPNEIVTTILPDPNTQNLIYASTTFSGVLVSLDGGQSWQSINSGLVPRNISNLALSQDGSILYAGAGANGVWRLGDMVQP